MAEGTELIRTALDAGTPVESVYVSPDGDDDLAAQEVCRQAGAAGARVFSLGPGVLERVADTVTPQPILAVLPMLERAVGGRRELDRPAGSGSLVVVLVDVRDPGNAGTVLRAADASGCAAVIYAGDSVDPYNPKTVRASAGSLFHVPFAVRPDPFVVAAELSAAGFRTWRRSSETERTTRPSTGPCPRHCSSATSPRGSTRPSSAPLSGSLAIPMVGRAESLNVGVACAVVCFEAFRQRRGGGPGARSISGGGTTRHGD